MGENADGTESLSLMADTGSTDMWRTVNMVISVSPRSTRPFSPFISTFTVRSAHMAAATDSASSIRSVKLIR